MKKQTKALVSLLMVTSLLSACGNKTKETPVTSSSSSTTAKATETSSTKPSSSPSSQTETSVSEKSGSMDVQAISNGDLSSIVGTWETADGYTLVFNEDGLVNEGAFLSTTFTLTDNIIETAVNYQMGSGHALMMIPAGVKIPARYFYDAENATDPTDISRDRMVGSQSALTAESMVVYYHVSMETTPESTDPLKRTDTGIELDTGQVTIDYTNNILGNLNWVAIESNYNRTESIPYELLQGSDQSLYYVYQNGVITDVDGNIVYEPK